MKQKFLISALLLTAISAWAVWTIPLPPGTSVTVPLYSINVVGVKQPLPGDDTTDTLISLSLIKGLSVETNGVSGSVHVSADLVVRVQRAEIESLLGQAVGDAKQSVLTNAVQQIAFAKLGSSIPSIAAGLSAPDR